MPVDALYYNAHNSLDKRRLLGIERAFQRLIARFPSGPYTEQAQLELAYSQYKDNKPDDACPRSTASSRRIRQQTRGLCLLLARSDQF